MVGGVGLVVVEKCGVVDGIDVDVVVFVDDLVD